MHRGYRRAVDFHNRMDSKECVTLLTFYMQAEVVSELYGHSMKMWAGLMSPCPDLWTLITVLRSSLKGRSFTSYRRQLYTSAYAMISTEFFTRPGCGVSITSS